MDVPAIERVLLFAHEESAAAAALPAPVSGAAGGRRFRPLASEMLADVTQAKA